MINIGKLLNESKRRNFKNKSTMLDILRKLNADKNFINADSNEKQLNILKTYLNNCVDNAEHSVFKSLIYGLELEADPKKIHRKR